MNAPRPFPQARRLPRRRGGLLQLLPGLVIFGFAACAGGAESSPTTQFREAAASIAPDVPSLIEEEASSLARADIAQTPERTVLESGGFKLASLSSAYCTAEAPWDWTMQAPDRSDRADVYSPDGTMYAGYGILPVNTTLADFAYAYDPPQNDPDLYSSDPATVALAYGRIVVALLGGSPDLAYAGDLTEPATGYLLMTVAGSTHQGAIFFRASGFPGDGINYSYALPMYFAFTTSDLWERQGALVARVAASIRCFTQLQPPDDGPDIPPTQAGDGDPNGGEAGYNPQLGTEQVNDPTTGENYLVDPSVNWSETGPDGSGYYVNKGGGYSQKLEPGRVD